MRKFFLVCAMAVFGLGQSFAQLDTDDYGIFNHVGIGVGFGTTGITLDAASVITPYVGIRAGVDIVPSFKVNTTLDTDFNLDNNASAVVNYGQYNIPEEIDVEAKPSLTTGHVLIDFFPFPNSSSFRITAGAYFGSDKIVKLYNKDDGALSGINAANRTLIGAGLADATTHENMIGLALGDYFLTPDDNGNVEARIKVSSFRPYLGIGFGRAVPKKRIGCQFDLGVQFWGKPEVYLQDAKLTKEDVNGDGGDVIKTISKISVYPNISFRLVGRLF